jgi:hypothetical protein
MCMLSITTLLLSLTPLLELHRCAQGASSEPLIGSLEPLVSSSELVIPVIPGIVQHQVRTDNV